MFVREAEAPTVNGSGNGNATNPAAVLAGGHGFIAVSSEAKAYPGSSPK